VSAAPAIRLRRTQEERSSTTRARLLDATIDCLLELGYAGTTTTEIAAPASRAAGSCTTFPPSRSW
jgi:hypothetical protein